MRAFMRSVAAARAVFPIKRLTGTRLGDLSTHYEIQPLFFCLGVWTLLTAGHCARMIERTNYRGDRDFHEEWRDRPYNYCNPYSRDFKGEYRSKAPVFVKERH